MEIKSFCEKLIHLMKKNGDTYASLAKNVKISDGLVAHYVRGRRLPSRKTLYKIAAYYKVNPAWLLSLDDGMENFSQKKLDLDIPTQATTLYNVRDGAEIKTAVAPLISLKDVLLGKNAVKKASFIETYLPFPAQKCSNYVYAVRIKGNAMSSLSFETKSLNDDSIVFADPTLKPKHKSIVFALLPEAKEPICRRYVIDGGKAYLVANNPQWPMIEVTPDVKICSVVQARVDFDL